MRSISGVRVSAAQAAVSTDRDGRFSPSLPPGPVRLTVDARSHLREQVDITVGGEPVAIEALLLDEAQFKEDVVVTAGLKLTVRGGGPDQNLTLMDGVEIHNPYRLFGLTSAFNPEVVENVELIGGGLPLFPSRRLRNA
jgi:hypothetical protein